MGSDKAPVPGRGASAAGHGSYLVPMAWLWLWHGSRTAAPPLRPLTLHRHPLPLSPCKPGFPLGCRDLGSHRCWVLMAPAQAYDSPCHARSEKGSPYFGGASSLPSQLTPSDLPRPVQELVLGPVVPPLWVMGPVVSLMWVQWDQSWPQCRDWGGLGQCPIPTNAQRWGE